MPANRPENDRTESEPHLHGNGDDIGPGTLASSAPDGGAVPLVEVTRGDAVESRHRGAAVVVDARGRVADYWGDLESPVFPRSAIKPIQALPLVEMGAADAFGLDDAELALACSSHSGEAIHTGRVVAWLERIGCGVDDLACGTSWPLGETAARLLAASNEAPSALHNNCSGKHSGFLTTARHLGEPISGYHDYAHPTQQRWIGVLEQMSGQDLGIAPRGLDGCSIPTIALPIGALAMAMARFADPVDLPSRRIDAVGRIVKAWGSQPYMIAGQGRFDTALIEASSGKILVKGGAEGVLCASLPELGLGVAVKIDDGAGRAAEVAMMAMLRRIGALDAVPKAEVERLARPTVKTWTGLTAGEVRPVVSLSPTGPEA